MTHELNENSTLKEVLESKKFAALMNAKIADTKANRRKWINNHKGNRPRRTAWDTLEDLDLLYADKILVQFNLMGAKQCTLSLREREYIHAFVTEIVYDTVEYFEKLRKKEYEQLKKIAKSAVNQEFEDAPKPRKPRAKK